MVSMSSTVRTLWDSRVVRPGPLFTSLQEVCTSTGRWSFVSLLLLESARGGTCVGGHHHVFIFLPYFTTILSRHPSVPWYVGLDVSKKIMENDSIWLHWFKVYNILFADGVKMWSGLRLKNLNLMQSFKHPLLPRFLNLFPKCNHCISWCCTKQTYCRCSWSHLARVSPVEGDAGLRLPEDGAADTDVVASTDWLLRGLQAHKRWTAGN